MMSDAQHNTYWVQVFNETTWREFLNAGGNVTGFRDKRWAYISNLMKQSDILLCYLSGHSKWIGILEVVSAPFIDVTPIWQQEIFPCRASVKIVASLPLERAIPVQEFKNEVSVLRGKSWSLYFINSPTKWKTEDGRIVEAAILATARRWGRQV